MLTDNLASHPAFLAWKQVEPKARQPDAIEILKESRKKTTVFRLISSEVVPRSVIAKRCRAGSLDTEIRICTEILPQLGLSTLAHYGYLEEFDGHSWIFQEDAGDVWYSRANVEHQGLVVDWLSRLHAGASGALPVLPETGETYFRAMLDTVREGTRISRGHAGLTAAERPIFDSILSHLDVVECGWPLVAAACAQMPRTLVHGDFVPKNVRMSTRNNRLEVLVFDWETAGLAPPAADIAELPRGEPQLRRYLSNVRECWPQLDWEDIQRLHHIGRLFRCLHSVCWALVHFESEWIRRAVRYMEDYESSLRTLVRDDPWLVH